jgi:hypothetical protein
VGSWTEPRIIAYRNHWCDLHFDYDGPCCYELGTGGVRRGRIEWHYVGETINERRRMIQYASYGSHLAEIIRWHLRQGWCLYYRSYGVDSKQAAVAMQNRLLRQYKYDWNVA